MGIARLRDEIETFYFNTSKSPLFGCYHAPDVRHTSRDCGVILCYPMGHEYAQSHRAYRQLAIRLSKAGFHVLRFDFYGCGDSSGDYEQGSIQQWTLDISASIEELKRRAGSVQICLVGLRLGGTLATMYGIERGEVDGLVLWDVIVNGKAYIEKLVDFQKEKFISLGTSVKPLLNRKIPTELLGFPLTEQMYADFNQINLLAIPKRPATHLLLIDSNEKAGDEQFLKHLKSMDAHFAYEHLPGPQLWVEDINKVMIPNQVLQSITSWISEVYK